MTSSTATTSALPLPSLSFFVFDTGTTGVDPSTDHLQSLSVLLVSKTFRPSAIFSTQVRPPTLAPHPRIPDFRAAWQSAQSFIEENTGQSSIPILVAHSAPFDSAFLLSELLRSRLTIPDFLVSDSLSLARSIFSPPPAKYPYSQESLARHFNIPVHKPHTSQHDVSALAKILSNLSQLASTPLHHILYDNAIPLTAMARRYNSFYSPSSYSFSSLSNNSRASSRLSMEHSSITETSHPSVRVSGMGSHKHKYVSEDADRADTSTVLVDTGVGMYHTDRTCIMLDSDPESIPVNSLPSSLKRCSLCFLGDSASVVTTPTRGDNDADYRASRREVEDWSRGRSGREIWTTATGKYYHGAADCIWLKSAHTTYKVDVVKGHLRPCPKCWKGELAKVGDSARGGKWIFFTKNDRYFHEERNCYELDTKRKVLAMREKPAGLKACARCCRSNVVARSASEGSDSVSHSSNVNRSFRASGSGKEYFITTYGKYYHEDKSCGCLSNAKTLSRVSIVPSRFQACYKCVTEPAVLQSELVSGTAEKDTNCEVGGRIGKGLGTSARVAFKHEVDIPIETSSSAVYTQQEVTKGSTLNQFTGGFFKTRTGTKFHVSRDCRTIRNKHCMPCLPLEEDKDPCKVCALGLYQEWSAEGWIS
eukprot:GFKZ01006229.1.p1 GENE.GFKZ01006229.1~~GFKZ01006229.1.p1  ORF type:complete len:648 (-),score=35.31 GFKZ01006229.1:526-2469(-)